MSQINRYGIYSMEDIDQINLTSTPKRGVYLNQYSLKIDTPKRDTRSSLQKKIIDNENGFISSNNLEPLTNKSHNLNLYNIIDSSQRNDSPNRPDEPTSKFQFSEFIKHNSSLTNSPKSLTPNAIFNTSIETKITTITQKIKNSQYENQAYPYDMNINNALKPALRIKKKSFFSSSPVNGNTISHPSKIEKKREYSTKMSTIPICSSPILPKSQLLDYDINDPFPASVSENQHQIYSYNKGNICMVNETKSKEDFIASDPNLECFDNIEPKENNLIYQNLMTSQVSTYSVIDRREESEERQVSQNENVSSDRYKMNSIEAKGKCTSQKSNNSHIKNQGRKKKTYKKRTKGMAKGKIRKKSVLKDKTNVFNKLDMIKIQKKETTTLLDISLFSTSSEEVNLEKEDDEYIPNRQTRSRKRFLKDTIKELEIEKKKRQGLRSKNGCWTCRVRHKACPENKPICGQCERLKLICDYSEERPTYMTNAALQAAKLREIRDITSKQKKINFVRKRANSNV